MSGPAQYDRHLMFRHKLRKKGLKPWATLFFEHFKVHHVDQSIHV